MFNLFNLFFKGRCIFLCVNLQFLTWLREVCGSDRSTQQLCTAHPKILWVDTDIKSRLTLVAMIAKHMGHLSLTLPGLQVENHLLDLHSQSELILPGYFALSRRKTRRSQVQVKESFDDAQNTAEAVHHQATLLRAYRFTSAGGRAADVVAGAPRGCVFKVGVDASMQTGLKA